MTPEQPQVSIVLPTHNRAAMLPKAMETCLNQTYRDIELIIVDDASTDDTRAIVEDFASRDSRVVYIRHLENKRLPAALNTGFAAARGHYFTWTSDDNYYRPDALERMVTFLDNRADVGLVYAKATLIDENGKPEGPVSVSEPHDLLLFSCVGACFMYRRKVAERIGEYSEGLFLAEDYDYWLRICHHFKAVMLHEDLYLYRKHPASLSTVYREKAMEVAKKTLMRNVPAYHRAGGLFGARAHLITARVELAAGRVSLARRHLWRATIAAPREPLRFDRNLVANVLLGPRMVQIVRSAIHRLSRGSVADEDGTDRPASR